MRTRIAGCACAGNGTHRAGRLPAPAYAARHALVGLAVVLACVGGAGAAPLETSGGVSLGLLSVRHGTYASTDVPPAGAAPAPLARSVGTPRAGGGGLTIDVTFDSSITNAPNAAAIEAMINDAVAVHESLFNDPITVSIRFRYATTYADGSPLPGGLLAASQDGVHVVAWSSFVNALVGDATTANDTSANGTLPGNALSTNVDPSSANGRALGLNTPPVMFADGSVGVGGPYDGIITINSAQSFTYTRPPAGGTYDAQRSVEHEIDEVLGLGSAITHFNDVRPQDLFSWSSAGVRSISSTGQRYFSIDGGTTGIVGFNQDPNGDFGDWLSAACPQANPYVQNAFSCQDQTSDVTDASPEGINLDVIGYDLIVSGGSTTTVTTVTTSTSTHTSTTITTSTTAQTSTTVPTSTTLPCLPPQVECCPVGQPGCGVCGVDCGNGGCCPLNAPVCDNANNLCRSCDPGQIECCPVGQPGCGICGTDCQNGNCCPPTAPVCDNGNSVCLVSGPVCPGGQVQCGDSALGFTDVVCCDQPAKKKQCASACRPIVDACMTSCASTSKPKKCRKRCRTALVGHCRQSRPPACN